MSNTITRLEKISIARFLNTSQSNREDARTHLKKRILLDSRDRVLVSFNDKIRIRNMVSFPPQSSQRIEISFSRPKGKQALGKSTDEFRKLEILETRFIIGWLDKRSVCLSWWFEMEPGQKTKLSFLLEN